jgi:hypothetical protein
MFIGLLNTSASNINLKKFKKENFIVFRKIYHFFSNSLVVRISPLRWINAMIGVRTSILCIYNAMSYQLIKLTRQIYHIYFSFYFIF